MKLSDQISSDLAKLAGFASTQPQTASVSGPDSIRLEIDFTAVERMSCSFCELRLHVPSLSGTGIDTLKEWADALSKRITYLMENIEAVEFDSEGDQVLIRSNPPHQQGNATRFYEVMLQTQSNGNFSLRRFESIKGQPGRIQVDIQTTHEVLGRLADDLVETIPEVN